MPTIRPNIHNLGESFKINCFHRPIIFVAAKTKCYRVQQVQNISMVEEYFLTTYFPYSKQKIEKGLHFLSTSKKYILTTLCPKN